MNIHFFRQQLSTYIHSQREQGPLWVFWLILLPIVPLIAYMFLGYLRILPEAEGIPRTLYIMVGVTCWLLLSDAVLNPYQGIGKYKSYFVRNEIGIVELLTGWIPERLLIASFQFSFCVAVVGIEAGIAATGLLKFLGIVLLGLFLCNTIGVLIGVLGLISPSTVKLIETCNRFLLFLSGVIFPLPDGEVVNAIKVFNPYYVFIDNARLALFSLPVDWHPLSLWICVGFLVFLFLAIKLRPIEADVRDYLQ